MDSGLLLTLGANITNMPLLTTLAAGFAAAWVLGLLARRLGLSPIVGYLVAGVVIGPFTPGFVGDPNIAQQLAEVGVILLMFGVGIHFHLKDLLAVKWIAIPGALGQSALATVASVVLLGAIGMELKPAMVLGMSMAVASTVVLMRVLMDQGLLNTSHGHVAVGWLIVEDILTVLALVFVPLLAQVGSAAGGAAAGAGGSAVVTIGLAIFKLVVFVVLLLVAGSRVVPWVLTRVARLRSAELFTLTVLVMSVAIAVGAAYFFDASVALGAFLAGMVVGQTPASNQAAADALPMRDAFGVIFFVSVGMLFDPAYVVDHPLEVAAGLAVVLLVKPLAALTIVAVLGYPARTGLIVAVALAQIGEFSFILSQVAREHGLLGAEGTSLLVAAAMVSITINPWLFKLVDPAERWMRRYPLVWKVIGARAEKAAAAVNAGTAARLKETAKPLALIAGYGPVGRVADALLRDAGFETSVVDMNIDTVRVLAGEGRIAVYGDATRHEVLAQAGIERASHLLITLPEQSDRAALVMAAREVNPDVEITVRARYLAEREPLQQAGAKTVVYEEGEAGLALARQVLVRRGVDSGVQQQLLAAIRRVWKMDQ